jgi:hypothetical protein
MSELKVNKISPRSGTDITLGDSADTITIPSGATLDASNATVTAIQQRLEGQMLQYIKKGTSNAESLTMSFWVKSNKTGTYTAEIFDEDNTRQITRTYTIDSSNTWEKKTLTFAGDTTGTLDNDNERSFEVLWWLGTGSDKTSGTYTDGVWQANVTANRLPSSQVNLADNTANEWYITGVQLEAGTTASDFEFLPVDVNLQRCLRYFYKWVSTNLYNNICIGRIQSATLGRGVFAFPQIMRATPSLSADGNFRVIGDQTLTLTGSGVSLGRANTNNIYIEMLGSGTGSTTSYACEMGANNDAAAEIAFSAEL